MSRTLPAVSSQNSGGGAAAQRGTKSRNESLYPNAVLADHPVAYYRLDDTGSTMTDIGPNSLNGAYGTAVTRGQSPLVPDSTDPSVSFPGGSWSSNAIATVGQSSTLQPASVSVEAWVSESSANSSGTIDLVSYGSQTGGQGYSLQITSSNTLKFYVDTTTSPGYASATGATVLTPGSAYHIVATYDGTNAKVYVNGKLDGSGTGTSAISYAGIGTYGLSIGAGQSTSRNVFAGGIDDVSVYSSALSATQVTTHYNAALTVVNESYADTVLSDTPLAYYRLDETGPTAYDSTVNRVNGSYGSSVTQRATGLISNTTDTAASFAGGSWAASKIVTVPQTTKLQPTTVSVEAWIKEAAANTSGYVDLVSYGDQSGQGYSLQLTPTNTLKFWLDTTGSPGYVALTSSTVLTSGTAYYVVATYDGTTAKLYINNTLDTSTTGSGNVSYSGIGTYGLSIGAGQDTSRNVFNGTIDEVAVYSGALASTSITKHSNATSLGNAQAGPEHIQNVAYYQSGRDSDVSLTYMTRHVDWVMNEDGDPTYNNQFRAAGGAHSAWYTDPNIIYHCSSPFGPVGTNTPGTCTLAPLGDSGLNTIESAWLHGTTAVTASPPSDNPAPAGARLHTDQEISYGYGDALNPGSSDVQGAYHTYTGGISGATPLDAFWMDDASPEYSTHGLIYDFGTTSQEYDALSNPDAQYNADEIALACEASKPVFFNGPGYTPSAQETPSAIPIELADDQAMYRSPCVRGPFLEGAFVPNGYRKSLNDGYYANFFIPIADRILMAQTMQKTALIYDYISCASGGSCTPDFVGDRMYALGGIWLVYDPRFTLAWNGVNPGNGDPNMISTTGTWDELVIEYELVPTQPVQTATGYDITSLQIADGHTTGHSNDAAGGAFRREFAQCYQNGTSIGRCAVVLNAESTDYTNGGVVSMPTLSASYTRALVLNDKPADNGGTITWSTTIPTSLQPTTAVILAQ